MADEKKVITREDLVKSLQDLSPQSQEGEGAENLNKSTDAPAEDPKPEETNLTKSTTDAVKDDGSDDLKKTINASQAMADFVNLVCKTNDTNLETLTKAINGNHEVGTALVKAVVDQNEKIGKLEKTLDAIADKMELPRESRAAVEPTDVLNKNVAGTGDPAKPAAQTKTPGQMKQQVNDTLLAMHKSITESGDTDKADRLAKRIVEFDTTMNPDVLGEEFLQPTLDIINGETK